MHPAVLGGGAWPCADSHTARVSDRQTRSPLAAFVNTWIGLKRKDGTLDAVYKHWILGQDAASVEPRWSIIRNVLHWVD